MKNFLIKCSIFLIYILVLYTIFPIIVDPFNVFHVKNIRSNGVEPNKNYIKMKYILDNPKKFNSFIFGSSRVGALNVKKINIGNFYNMTYSAGTPPEHLANLKTFLKNNISPEKIYIGVDSFSYLEDFHDHFSQQLRCPYEKITNDKFNFMRLYLNPSVAFGSFHIMFEDEESELYVKNFYETGSNVKYGAVSKFKWDSDEVKPSLGESFGKKGYINLKLALNSIQEIKNLCDKNNIELIIFTNPMHQITYRASIETQYFDFLKGLADITEFYNFSSLNNITLDNNNYLETSHYKAEVGDLMIDVMFNNKKYPELYKQGFGVKINKNNIDEFIKFLKSQLEK